MRPETKPSLADRHTSASQHKSSLVLHTHWPIAYVTLLKLQTPTSSSKPGGSLIIAEDLEKAHAQGRVHRPGIYHRACRLLPQCHLQARDSVPGKLAVAFDADQPQPELYQTCSLPLTASRHNVRHCASPARASASMRGASAGNAPGSASTALTSNNWGSSIARPILLSR